MAPRTKNAASLKASRGTAERELDDALFATLTSRAKSEAARGFVRELYATLKTRELKQQSRAYGRRSTADRFLNAIEAFAADLLRAYAEPQARGWTYRSLHAQRFTGARVGYRQFVRLVDLLKAARLIETRRGFQRKTNFGAGPVVFSSKAHRYRATSQFIRLAQKHRVRAFEYDDHFIDELPENPVALRAGSTWTYGYKLRGKSLAVPRAPKVERIRSEVRELNEFLRATQIEGGHHRHYIRIFNNGDHPKFDWNMGGRLYNSSSNSYQQLSGEKRRAMKLNGEPVTEIDMSASYLTILLSWYGRSLHTVGSAKDPYTVGPLGRHDRAAVKQWFVMTLGTKKLSWTWSKSAAVEFRKRTGRCLTKSRADEIRDAAVCVYPELSQWPQDRRSWADLMYAESEALVRTMLALMREHRVPSLTVHDSLIVPASKEKLAQWQLSRSYKATTGVLPILKTKKRT
jgi:hypothetical protein